jgi:hypothetical protein
MRSLHVVMLMLATATLSGCGGASAEAEPGMRSTTSSGGSAGSASGTGTDMSAVVIEMDGERWTGLTCPQKVVRVTKNPTYGGVWMVPAICMTSARPLATLELMVQGAPMKFETGSWSGDDVQRRIAVEFETDGYDVDTKRDRLEPTSRLTISTWDSESLIEGELDLVVSTAHGTATIRGPFTIAFEVR